MALLLLLHLFGRRLQMDEWPRELYRVKLVVQIGCVGDRLYYHTARYSAADEINDIPVIAAMVPLLPALDHTGM